MAGANAVERERAEKLQSQPDLIPEELRFHDLRHTHATGLIRGRELHQGHLPSARAQQHFRDLNVYGHVLSDGDAKPAGQADALFD